MSHSKSAIVVAPGFPAELIQELLSSRILSHHKDHDVLLPPERIQQYDRFIDEKKFFRVRFIPSPGRRFFSSPHLRWLRRKLKSSGNAMVLIPESPYHNLTSAIISILISLLAGKAITLLRPYQIDVNSSSESISDTHGQALSKRWLVLDLNLKTLGDDIYWRLHRIFYPKDPWDIWEILVLVMFAGLVIRQYLSSFFSSLVHKLQGE